MRSFVLGALVAIAIVISSCGSGPPKITQKRVDELSRIGQHDGCLAAMGVREKWKREGASIPFEANVRVAKWCALQREWKQVNQLPPPSRSEVEGSRMGEYKTVILYWYSMVGFGVADPVRTLQEETNYGGDEIGDRGFRDGSIRWPDVAWEFAKEDPNWVREIVRHCLDHTEEVFFAEIQKCIESPQWPDHVAEALAAEKVDHEAIIAEAYETRRENRARIGQEEMKSGRCSQERHADLQRAMRQVKDAMSAADCYFKTHEIVVASDSGTPVDLDIIGRGDHHVFAFGYGDVSLEVLDKDQYPVVIKSANMQFFESQVSGLNSDNRLVQANNIADYQTVVSSTGCTLVVVCKTL